MAILLLVAFAVWILRTGARSDEVARRQLKWMIVAILALWQIEWHIWYVVTGLWSVERQLPLHMCGIMIWVTIYGFVSGDRRVYPLIYFFGIAGAIQAVATPEAVRDFPHIRFLNTIISHGLLVISGLWVIVVEKYRPTWRDMGMSLIVVNLYALLV